MGVPRGDDIGDDRLSLDGASNPSPRKPGGGEKTLLATPKPPGDSDDCQERNGGDDGSEDGDRGDGHGGDVAGVRW